MMGVCGTGWISRTKPISQGLQTSSKSVWAEAHVAEGAGLDEDGDAGRRGLLAVLPRRRQGGAASDMGGVAGAVGDSCS